MLSESRSTQAAARAFSLNPKLLHRWQQAPPAFAADPNEAAQVRQLRAANRRLAQKLKIKKSIAIFSTPPTS
jgi:transposase